jgi:hypothetical protein
MVRIIGLRPARIISPERSGWAPAKVSGFVGDDALQLVGRLGLQDQAGIEAHHQALGGEGVQFLVADQQDANRLRIQPAAA